MGKVKDITGQRFGRLVVIEDNGERDSYRNVVWLCKCDCGNEKKVVSGSLKNGLTQSCGCLVKESAEKAHKHNLENDCKNKTRLSSIKQGISKNNTSGVKGVSWDKNKGMWLATLMFQRKPVLFKRFNSKQDAINARKEAEEKYFKPILEKYGKTQ